MLFDKKYSVLAGLLGVLVFCVPTLGLSANGEFRALIRFDHTGHHLHRLVRYEPTPQSDFSPRSSAQHRRAPASFSGRYSDNKPIAFAASPNLIVVQWLAADGQVLATHSGSDPRLTHAPLTADGLAPIFAVLPEGAYLLSGPLTSSHIQIDLPANPVLGLLAEQWNLSLDL